MWQSFFQIIIVDGEIYEFAFPPFHSLSTAINHFRLFDISISDINVAYVDLVSPIYSLQLNKLHLILFLFHF
jgi:hypothetical protein